jgi:hypothetical protein
MSKTLVALFDTSSAARLAASELDTAGFTDVSMHAAGKDASTAPDPARAVTAFGVPEHLAAHYAEAVGRGGTLLRVQVPDDRAQDAVAVLQRCGVVDLEKQAESWRKTVQAPEQAEAATAGTAEAPQQKRFMATETTDTGGTRRTLVVEETSAAVPISGKDRSVEE